MIFENIVLKERLKFNLKGTVQFQCLKNFGKVGELLEILNLGEPGGTGPGGTAGGADGAWVCDKPLRR